jgi:hypothetical protein
MAPNAGSSGNFKIKNLFLLLLLEKIKIKDPTFAPKHLFDFGSGVG